MRTFKKVMSILMMLAMLMTIAAQAELGEVVDGGDGSSIVTKDAESTPTPTPTPVATSDTAQTTSPAQTDTATPEVTATATAEVTETAAPEVTATPAPQAEKAKGTISLTLTTRFVGNSGSGTYDGTEQTGTFELELTDIRFIGDKPAGVTGDPTFTARDVTITAKNAGIYKPTDAQLWAAIAQTDPSYSDCEIHMTVINEATFTIAKRKINAVSIVAPADKTKVYDGTKSVPGVENPREIEIAKAVPSGYYVTSAELAAGDTFTATLESDSADASATPTTVRIKSLSVSPAGNYDIAETALTATSEITITPYAPAITIPDDVKTYDAALGFSEGYASPYAVSLKGNDVAYVDLELSGSKNVGDTNRISAKAIRLSEGAKPGNYKLPDAADIAPAKQTINQYKLAARTFSDEKVYDGQVGFSQGYEKSVQLASLNGESVTANLSVADKNVGEHPIQLSFTFSPEDAAANYDTSAVTCTTQVITAKQVNVYASATKVYDGLKAMSANDVTLVRIEGAVPGEELTPNNLETFTLDESAPVDASVTAYSVPIKTVTFNDKNYIGSGTVNLTIKKKPLTIKATGTKVYDRTASMARVRILSVDQSGLAAGDLEKGVELTLSPYDLGANAEAIEVLPSNLPPYKVPILNYTLSAPGKKSNYELTADSTLDLRITPEPGMVVTIGSLAVTPKAGYAKVYNGGKDLDANNFTFTSPDLAEGDTIVAATLETTGVEVGETDVVLLGGVVVRDANGNDVTQNYDFSAVTSTATQAIPVGKVTIVARELAVIAKGTKEYDGTAVLTPENVTVDSFSIVGLELGDALNPDNFRLVVTKFGQNANAIDASATPYVYDILEAKLEAVNADPASASTNYVFAPGSSRIELTIKPREYELSISGVKPFGVKDKAEDYALNVQYDSQVALSAGVENGALIIDTQINGDAFTWTPKAGLRAEGEKPGDYPINFDVNDLTPKGATKATNYHFVLKEGVDKVLRITDNAAFTVALVSPNNKALTTHDEALYYEISADEGRELIDDIADQMTLAYTADFADCAYIDEASATYAADLKAAQMNADGALCGAIELQPISYTYTFEDPAREPLTWQGYLPVGAVLSAECATVEAQPTVVYMEEDPAVITRAMVVLNVTYTSPANNIDATKLTADGALVHLLDANGTITIAGDESCEGAVYMLSSEGAEPIYTTADEPITMQDLAALATQSDGSWMGADPTGFIKFKVRMLDDKDHIFMESTQRVAFDTGAASGVQTVENRLPAGEVKLALAEAASAVVSVEGSYGGSAPTMEVNPTTGEITWTNPRAWASAPSTLPDEAQKIIVTYMDLVGNVGTQEIQLTKSQAKVDNEIYVRPASDGIVPSRDLVFYGTTTAWETSTLNIGGNIHQVKAEGAVPYADESVAWSVTVREEDLDFKVGVPTTISMSYDHLEGGDASITITYDDMVQKPSIGGGLVAGSRAFWGFLEASSAPALIDIRHADGSITPVMSQSVGQDAPGAVQINFMGYFYAALPVALQAGDTIIMDVTDFGGNHAIYEFGVQNSAPMQPFAELLGADILGPQSGNAGDTSSPMAHRYATPIDLSKLAGGQKSAQVPILIDKGIQLGTASFSLNGNILVMNYEITNPQFVPAGAQLRLETYDSKPGIADVLTVSGVAATNVADVPSGSVNIADVSGKTGGKIWLSVQIDVQFADVNAYIDKIGTSQANGDFYRWLSEQSQTRDILNNMDYTVLASYAKNVEYYKLYRDFQNM